MKNFYFGGMLGCLLLSGQVFSLSAQEAKIGDVAYSTLADAFVAANEGDKIVVSKDLDVDIMIPVTRSVTLDLNGKTITNNVPNNRLFRLSDVTFTIDGNDGSVITPEGNTTSYGFIDFRDAAGNAGASTTLIVSNANFKGATNEGSLFAFRGASGQSLQFDNVNVELTGGYTYSIINGYHMNVDIKLNGGKYVCNSTHQTAGVFQAGPGSVVDFNGVTVETSVGPIFEAVANKATFTDCTMTNTATNSFFAACIAASNGADVTVDGGTYTANYPLYVYNSGGTVNVDGGEFNGKIAAIQVDNREGADYESKVSVTNGTFNGPLVVDNRSELAISGGVYTDKNAENYCTDGFKLEANADGTYGVVPDSGSATGVEDIVIEGEKDSTVYNLNGVKVGDSVNGLTPGIYVVNGKKLLVK